MNEMDNLIKNLILDIQILKQRVQVLEENSHAKRDFIVCDKCNYKIKQYEGTD